MTTERWAVVGGGLMGLALALRLAEAGRRVAVFEAAADLGGLAAPARFDDVTWDRFYHVIIPTDIHLRGLLAGLGLDRHIAFRRTATGLHIAGRLRSLSGPRELLATDALPLRAKIGLVRTVLAAQIPTTPRALDRETAIDWLRRHGGEDAVTRIWRPLLRAKLGAFADRASALFIWTTLQRLYGRGAGRAGSGRFGHVPGGYARILEAFRANLAARGVAIHTAAPIETVERGTDGIAITTAAGARHVVDRAVVTLPGPHVARVVRGLDPAQRDAHARTAYLGVVCVSLLLDRPATPFYVTNLADGTAPFTGIIEMSNLMGREAFGGRSLVYLPRYVTADDPCIGEPDETIIRRFVEALAAMLPDFRAERVLAAAVNRAPHVLAAPVVGRLDTIPAVRTAVTGLYVVNGAQIVDGTLNANDTIRHAEHAAAVLLRAGVTTARAPLVAWWARTPPVDDALAVVDADAFLDGIAPIRAFRTEDRVLDIGCGPGLVAARLAGRVGTYVGLDVSVDALAAARLRTGATPSFRFLPLDPDAPDDLGAVATERFDVALCNSVIQYLPDAPALERLFRALRPLLARDGVVLIGDVPVRWRPLREAGRIAREALGHRRGVAILAGLVRRALAPIGARDRAMRPTIHTPATIEAAARSTGLAATILPARHRPAGNRIIVVLRAPAP